MAAVVGGGGGGGGQCSVPGVCRGEGEQDVLCAAPSTSPGQAPISASPRWARAGLGLPGKERPSGPRDSVQEAGLPGVRAWEPARQRREEERGCVRVCVCVCVCVCLCTHSSWFDLNPPQPEIATTSASLAWGGVSPLWNLILRINIPAACQLCCKLLAHGFACVLIIQPCVAKWEMFFYSNWSPSLRCHTVSPSSSVRSWHTPRLASPFYV